MNIRVRLSDPPMGPEKPSEFPWVRLDSGHMSYNEALIEGRYLFAGSSAMGRPMSRSQVLAQAHPRDTGVNIPFPWSAREEWESAFGLTINGQTLLDGWQWVGQEEVTPARPDGSTAPRSAFGSEAQARREASGSKTGSPPSGRELSVTLRHERLPVEVNLHTRIDGTPFITRHLVVKNLSAEPLCISQAYTWSGKLWQMGSWPAKPLRHTPAYSLGTFASYSWGHEGEFRWQAVPMGSLAISNISGGSGWGMPFFLLRNESTGEVVVGHLAWSGRWSIETLQDQWQGGILRNELYLRAGIAGAAPLRVLERDESATLPAMHLGHLFGGVDEAVQALHEHLRRSTVPPLVTFQADPVCANHYGYTEGTPVRKDYLLKEVEIAARVGAEVFVVDAGWFGGGQGDYISDIGDWQESPLLAGGSTPGSPLSGLKAVSQDAHRRGMKFGLWVEPERIAPDSRVAKEHPDWYLHRRGVNYQQLDLANPAVEQHLLQTITRLVETYELDLFRMDYNILQTAGGQRVLHGKGGDLIENTQWRYYDALYRMLDNLKRRFPNLLMENCASGGGRNDLGLLSRFNWTQSTDNWDPPSQLRIFNGLTMALPPEQVLVHLGCCSPGVADVDFMLRIGLFGHMSLSGMFPSPEEIQQPSLERWQHAAGLYKSFVRPFLRRARMFHHTAELEPSSTRCVLELACPEGSRVMAGFWSLAGAKEGQEVFRPKGVNLAKRYKVTSDNRRQSYLADGGTLANQGIVVPTGPAGTSELLMLETLAE